MILPGYQSKLDNIGEDWLNDQAQKFSDTLERPTPSQFNEEFRYLSRTFSTIPGYISFDVNPYMREIIDCADVNSDVREVNLMKGVQITYSTMLESIILYYIVIIKTFQLMYMSADSGMAKDRIARNIIPMLNDSGFDHLIQSGDINTTRKTGKTADLLEWLGGGSLRPIGATNADKLRNYVCSVMLKDEIDAWARLLGNDGDPDSLSDARLKGGWESRKIYRGSTPLIKGSSLIEYNYLRGDQRKYFVCCIHCGFPQFLIWQEKNKETGNMYGLHWDTDGGILDKKSVHYRCIECSGVHYNHDKLSLFSEKKGAEWIPTGTPVADDIRSYHLPAMYSPLGMAPWHSLVTEYMSCYDYQAKEIISIGKYQVFYNNVRALPFEMRGSRVYFSAVSAHRRREYVCGVIPNDFAEEYCGSKILFLTCQVDVQKRYLSVAVMGWTRDARCFVIDYDEYRVEDEENEDCLDIHNPVWGRLTALIDDKVYVAGKFEYRIMTTFIDSNYGKETVVDFCGQWGTGVFPIIGGSRPPKAAKIMEFDAFQTKLGTIGWRITVDHYKDRLNSILRRSWDHDMGDQLPNHFNAPLDMTDKQLTELTAEVRVSVIKDGHEQFIWERKGNNELWDLLVYGHAAVDILAYNTCIQVYGKETVDFNEFYDYMEERLMLQLE